MLKQTRNTYINVFFHLQQHYNRLQVKANIPAVLYLTLSGTRCSINLPLFALNLFYIMKLSSRQSSSSMLSLDSQKSNYFSQMCIVTYECVAKPSNVGYRCLYYIDVFIHHFVLLGQRSPLEFFFQITIASFHLLYQKSLQNIKKSKVHS